jgi:hypothetical protein
MSLKDQISTLSENSALRVMDALGLEKKRETTDYVLPALGIFGAGLVVGAALGLLFAPKPGAELRHELQRGVKDIRHRGEEMINRRRNHGDGEDEPAA